MFYFYLLYLAWLVIAYIIWKLSRDYQDFNHALTTHTLEESRKLNEDDLNNPEAEKLFSNSQVIIFYIYFNIHIFF